jgi:hypothetical protein
MYKKAKENHITNRYISGQKCLTTQTSTYRVGCGRIYYK